MGRAPCCDKMGMKKGPWTHEEDQILVSYVEQFGHGNWRALPKLAGLLRCGKSCRLRWMNYLRPDIKRGNFTIEEEETIIELHKMLGNRWSAIAAKLPGRTDNEIKNVWHTYLKKRLNVNDIETSNSSSSLTHHEHDHRSPIVEDDTGITGRQRDIISHCRSKSVDVLTKESESENGSDSSVSIKYSSKTTKADTSENCYVLEQPSEDFWSQMLSSNVMFSVPDESGIEVESLSKVDRVPYYEDATMQGLGDERDFWCNILSKMGEFPELLEI